MSRRAVAALLGWLGALVAAASPGVAFDARAFELDNGIRVLLVPRPELASVHAGWAVGSGSGDDPPGQSGLAHFLEHLMFKGSEGIGAADLELDRLYREAGASGLNAFTTSDATVYVVTLPANKLELWFWLESDRLRAPLFTGIDVERKVVRQEQGQAASGPAGTLEERLDAAFWGSSPYRRSRFGEPGELEAIGEPEVRRFFTEHYGSGNLTLLLLGRFDPEQVERWARAYFGRLPRRPAPVRTAPEAEPPLAERRVGETCLRCTPQWSVRYPAPAAGHRDGPALELLASVLNGRSGRLWTGLVGPGLASRASAELVSQRWGGYLAVRAEARGATTPAELAQAWDRLVVELETRPITAQELGRAQSQLVADGYRRLSNPYFLVGQVLASAGQGDWRRPFTRGEAALAVTLADLQGVRKRFLVPAGRLVATVERAPAPPAGAAP